MDKEREALMITISAVRTRAREIIELCEVDDMPQAIGDTVKAKCAEFLRTFRHRVQISQGSALTTATWRESGCNSSRCVDVIRHGHFDQYRQAAWYMAIRFLRGRSRPSCRSSSRLSLSW